jgi:hypothetical protein
VSVPLVPVSMPVPVPQKVPVPQVRLPRIPLPHDVLRQTAWAAQAVRANLPPTDRLAYYGGIGLMAALGVLEWPVAGAVGAGVWVASHARRRRASADWTTPATSRGAAREPTSA